MHWPQRTSSEIDRVDTPEAIIVLRENARLKRPDFRKDVLSDLLRASLVMLVSAIDAYFHAKIIAHVVRLANKGTAMPKALCKANISVGDFVKAKSYKRPMTVMRNALCECLGYQALQSPDNISSALSLIGIKDFWSKVAGRMGAPKSEVVDGLKRIVKRRNQIAHEADLSQSKKARNSITAIAPKDVRRALGFSLKLIPRAEKEINSQLK